MLGPYVKGPNNKIGREQVERLGLGHQTMVGRGFHDNIHKGELGVSDQTFSRHGLGDSGH